MADQQQIARKVYIFRGAPASGKGSVVPGFSEAIDSAVTIEQDAFRWGNHTQGRKPADITEDEHKAAYGRMVAGFEQRLLQGISPVVIEGLFTWNDAESSQGNVQELMQLAREHVYEAHSIVLKASRQVLLERNAARGYSVPSDEFERLYEGVYSTIDRSELVIDSTELNADQTLQLICSRLSV